MHGTFDGLPKRTPPPEAIEPWTTLVTSLALASIPLILATVGATMRYGSKVSIAKIVGILVAGTIATPM